MAKIKGARRVSRLMRKLPDALKANVATEIKLAGEQYLAAAKIDARHKTGALRRGLGMKITAKGLKVRIGIIGKALANRLFYGRILEFGRKARTVTVHRRVGAGAGGRGFFKRRSGVNRISSTYTMHVRARAAEPFVTKRRPALREAFRERLSDVWAKSLATVAGVGNDD